jgi:hypothetical protein
VTAAQAAREVLEHHLPGKLRKQANAEGALGVRVSTYEYPEHLRLPVRMPVPDTEVRLRKRIDVVVDFLLHAFCETDDRPLIRYHLRTSDATANNDVNGGSCGTSGHEHRSKQR